MVVRSWASNRDEVIEHENITIKSIATNDQHNEGMFAKGRLQPSDIICSVREPLLLALDGARLNDTCYNCHRQPQNGAGEPTRSTYWQNLRLCSGCKLVRYCSQQCQRVSWKEVHKHECQTFHSLYPRVMPTSMRALFRLIKLKDLGLWTQFQWDSLIKCTSHIEEISKQRDEENMRTVQETRALIELTKTKLEFSIVFEMYCRLKINAITLMTPTFDPLGGCLHPLISKINHGCNPNSYIRFGSPDDANTGIEVTPLRQIDTDEEITISYVDENKPLQMRQEELLTRYYFLCKCSRCVKEGRDPDSTRIDFSSKEKHVLAQVEDLIKDVQTHTLKQTPTQRLQLALRVLTTNKWQKQMFPYPQALQKLVTSYIDEGDFSSALSFATIQTFHVDPVVYTTEFHPMRLVHLYVLIRLVGVVAADSPSLDLTQQTPGNEHMKIILPDLWHWHADLSTMLREQASKTYARSESRCQMFPEAYAADLSRHITSHQHSNDAEKGKREVRMREMIDNLYARLHAGPASTIKETRSVEM